MSGIQSITQVHLHSGDRGRDDQIRGILTIDQVDVLPGDGGRGRDRMIRLEVLK
jgi:hypothetical protein